MSIYLTISAIKKLSWAREAKPSTKTVPAQLGSNCGSRVQQESEFLKKSHSANVSMCSSTGSVLTKSSKCEEEAVLDTVHVSQDGKDVRKHD